MCSLVLKGEAQELGQHDEMREGYKGIRVKAWQFLEADRNGNQPLTPVEPPARNAACHTLCS